MVSVHPYITAPTLRQRSGLWSRDFGSRSALARAFVVDSVRRRQLSSLSSKMVARCTRRSMAATVMAGSGKILSHWPNGLVGGVQQEALLVTCADQVEQDAGLGLTLVT